MTESAIERQKYVTNDQCYGKNSSNQCDEYINEFSFIDWHTAKVRTEKLLNGNLAEKGNAFRNGMIALNIHV